MRMLISGRDFGSWPADLGVFVARAFAGAALAIGHGWSKVYPSGPAEPFVNAIGELGFPQPLVFAWAAGLAELVGGALIAVGLLTRPAALAVAVNMAVAAFLYHAGDPFFGQPSKELALLYLSIAVMVLLAGPGRISIDRVLAGRAALEDRHKRR